MEKLTFWQKLVGSADNVTKNAFSGRKLTGIFSVLIAAYITIFLLPEEAQLHALYAWLLVALLCLSIITVENIIMLKNGTTTTTKETKESSETTTETK